MGRRNFLQSLQKQYDSVESKIVFEEGHDATCKHPMHYKCILDKRKYRVPRVSIPPTPTMSEEESEEYYDEEEESESDSPSDSESS